MRIHVPARWAALLLGLVFAWPALAQSGAGSGAAVVAEVTGTVFIQVGNGAPRLLQPGQGVPSGATLLAGADANAVLRFADGQIAVMGERSAFRIVDYRYDPKDPTQSRDVLNVISGSVRVIAGAIGDRNPASIHLHVGKGTIFPVVPRDGGKTGAATITVERIDTLVTVSQGQAYLSLANGNGVLIASGGGIYVQPSGNYQQGSADQVHTLLSNTSYGRQLAGWLQTMQSFEVPQRIPRMVITVTAPSAFEVPRALGIATGAVTTLETTASEGAPTAGGFCSASCN